MLAFFCQHAWRRSHITSCVTSVKWKRPSGMPAHPPCLLSELKPHLGTASSFCSSSPGSTCEGEAGIHKLSLCAAPTTRKRAKKTVLGSATFFCSAYRRTLSEQIPLFTLLRLLPTSFSLSFSGGCVRSCVFLWQPLCIENSCRWRSQYSRITLQKETNHAVWTERKSAQKCDASFA